MTTDGPATSPVVPLTVAAKRSVCASTCTTHDCYKGNDTHPGCPVWHHPQLVSEAHRCKTCLTCLIMVCTIYTFGMLWLVA